MDLEAHSACLRALRIISRSARLCAGLEVDSIEYIRSCEGAERSIERAQAHYDAMRQGHAAHERAVRFVGTAVVEARGLVLALTEALAEPEDLERLAGKVERAISRAQAGIPTSAPPARPTLEFAPQAITSALPPSDQD